jgi:thymidylate synthase (FAD)
MFLTKSEVSILTPIEGDRGFELLRLIEDIGRTCWKSEEKRSAKMDRLMKDPTYEPETWQDSSHQDLRQSHVSRKITDDFIRFIVKVGHESVLEHVTVSVLFSVDRSTSHQLVRHRLGSFCQESQRWCDYESKGHIAFIMPNNIPLESGFYEWREGIPRKKPARLLHHAERWSQRPYPGSPIEEWPVGIGFLRDREANAEDLPWHKWPSSAGYKLEAFQFAENAYFKLRSAGDKPEDARCVLPNATKTDIVATFNLRQWRHVFQERAINPKAQRAIREVTALVLAKFKETPLAPVFEDITN